MTKDLFSGLPLQLDLIPEPSTGLIRSIFLAPEHIASAAKRLLDHQYHLEDISGMDVAEGFLVTYHFQGFEQPGRIALRVLVAHGQACVPSIAGIFQGAEWHERELHDFFGVVFEGNPNPVALLLPDDDPCTPLCRTEATRKPLGQLMAAGTQVFRDPEFGLLQPMPEKRPAE
jgi:NADH-quinone oxidoreductase subunit C